jgi:hypothetical protein
VPLSDRGDPDLQRGCMPHFVSAQEHPKAIGHWHSELYTGRGLQTEFFPTVADAYPAIP